MQLAQFYQDTIKKFSQAGIEDARSDTVHLLCFCLGLTRTQLFLHSANEINDRQLQRCRELVCRRLAREPLHYITGTREFWSLEFQVSPAVLIPRPETEFLLEQVLKTLDQTGYKGGTILDMCTGSGVISVVLALELAASRVIAVDRSEEALCIAAANIARHKKKNEISLVCSDLFSALSPHCGFELIVANPPYIAVTEFADLQPEVQKWEPETALAGGSEGLDVIEKLADHVFEYLVPGGWLFIEIGADQKESVYAIFAGHASDAYECVEIINDWSERPRVLKARRKR
ncbi:MAG: peptide chain release factor N(5)-glutamine methyltransferase [Desulfobulbaceae bacterium]|nr:peptide chain release factor N(5)-glutamine methyltransferase [Desulfobulbaceae bacterium]